MKTCQFLLTRFNCQLGIANPDQAVSDEWLAHRFILFENFCLPSVQAQDENEFFWILLIDERTPAQWVDRLNQKMGDLSPRVIIIPVNHFDETAMIREMKRIAGDNSDRIITTRLDNDDAIARNYLSQVAGVSRSLEPGGNYVLNYSNGCIAHRTGIYEFHPSYLNPFLSVISSMKCFTTAMHANHIQMKCAGTVIRLDGEPDLPMWMQVVHSKNIYNRLPAKRKKISNDHICNFSIAENWTSLL